MMNPGDSEFLFLNFQILPTRGHNFKLYKENCKTEKRKFTFSFSQRITTHWNTLPCVIVNELMPLGPKH